jgi:hypothetical protein
MSRQSFIGKKIRKPVSDFQEGGDGYGNDMISLYPKRTLEPQLPQKI